MKVLLLSPIDGRDAPSGDTSYTQSLLDDPPSGVTYTTYEDALLDGTLTVRGRKPWNSRPQSTLDLIIFLIRMCELALRRSRVMFREPIWHVSVLPGAFDVIHQHVFAARQYGSKTPVVSSAGYPLSEHYRFREGWGNARLAIAVALEQTLARLLDVNVPWLRPTHGSLMTVYTDHFKQWLVARDIEPNRVEVVSTGLPTLAHPDRHSDGRTVAFIGRDFDRKGGPAALAAFDILRKLDPAWRMLVVTAGRVDVPEGVTLIEGAIRTYVVEQVLPQVDVLLAPTQADCGAPYTVLEALQAGVGVVLSAIPWLDERLCGPAVRRVPPISATAIAEAVSELAAIDADQRVRAAQTLVSTEFSMEFLQGRLGAAYRMVASHA